MLESIGLVDQNGRISSLTCQRLVIAAGPWTPMVFEALFPASTIDLRPVIDVGDYIIFRHSEPTSDECIAAVYMDDIVGHKLEFAGRNDSTIWLCGERGRPGKIPPVGETAPPSKEAIVNMMGHAEKFLKHGDGKACRLRVASIGRAFRPDRQSGLPVIAAVPRSMLAANQDEAFDDNTSTIFLCSGHGHYGVTLGLGSGRLMSQIVLGVKTDIDLSLFGLH